MVGSRDGRRTRSVQHVACRYHRHEISRGSRHTSKEFIHPAATGLSLATRSKEAVVEESDDTISDFVKQRKKSHNGKILGIVVHCYEDIITVTEGTTKDANDDRAARDRHIRAAWRSENDPSATTPAGNAGSGTKIP